MAARTLKNQSDISRALAHIYREVDANRMDVAKARALIYCALSLSSVLSEHDLEARILALETQASLRKVS